MHGLDPGELFARGLNTVQSSSGPLSWLPPGPEELARLLPQYQIEEAQRKETVANDQKIFTQHANVLWMARAAQLRKNAEALYSQFRAAARQAVAAK